METNKKRVAIVGGGITGLAAAFTLEKAIKNGSSIHYDLYEKTDRLGGKIQTEQRDGFIIERGPDSFLARKKSMSILAKEVGIDHEMLHNDTGQAFILKEGTLHPIPKGAVMGIPTEIKPFIKTNLVSPLGKLRATRDLFLPAFTSSDEDISLGHFFRRRLGDEVVDHMIEPLLSGIYAGDLDKLSLRATFPQYQEMEAEHGSLIKGITKSRKQQPSVAKPDDQPKKQGMFLSFEKGLESFVDAIEQKLDKKSVHRQADIININKVDHHFIIEFSDGETKHYDSVIMATPPHVTAELLSSYPYFDYLSQIEATSVATVAMAYKEEQVELPYDGTGFVVSKKGDHVITACTWTHKKWKHTAPDGFALLRAYVGRPNDSAIVHQSDEDIVSAALNDLKQIINIKGQPEFSIVTRWKEAMPQYHVGHSFKIEKLKEDVTKYLNGLYLVGGAYEGIGLPDCIDQGQAAANDILGNVTKTV